MNTSEEKPKDKISETKKPPRGKNVDWGKVVFGILAVGVGILSTTPVVTNPFYKDLWWFLVLVGSIAIVWGFASGGQR